jgi:post-segregation antitoxin (ccd killing protein)
MTPPKIRRTAANLKLRKDLVAEAKRLHVNLADVFDNALEAAIAHRRAQIWLKENERAIDGYNARVANQGVFSSEKRR